MTNDTFFRVPCSDPECVDGKILVYDAYSANPLEGEEQPCDRCNGTGETYFLICSTSNEDAN